MGKDRHKKKEENKEENRKKCLWKFFSPFYFFYHPSTCLSDAKHTCALLKSFAGLWRTSNKYKLCPTKIDRSLTCCLAWTWTELLWDQAKLTNFFGFFWGPKIFLFFIFSEEHWRSLCLLLHTPSRIISLPYHNQQGHQRKKTKYLLSSDMCGFFSLCVRNLVGVGSCCELGQCVYGDHSNERGFE